MSTIMNGGVRISCREVTNQVCTVVGLLVDIITTIEKSKGSIKLYTSISEPSIKLTSNGLVISYFLLATSFLLV